LKQELDEPKKAASHLAAAGLEAIRDRMAEPPQKSWGKRDFALAHITPHHFIVIAFSLDTT
jgi:hypothetical protein